MFQGKTFAERALAGLRVCCVSLDSREGTRTLLGRLIARTPGREADVAGQAALL